MTLGIRVSLSNRPFEEEEEAPLYPTSLPIVPAAGSTSTSVLQGDGSYLVTKTGATGYDLTSSVILGDANGDLNGEILTGDFVIVVEPLNLATHARFGMDNVTNGNHDDASIQIALVLNAGNQSTYEYNRPGNSMNGPHAYGGATVFFMRRIGNTVSFWKGNSHDIGAASLMFTSAGSWPPTHYFASAFFEQGGQWKLRVYNG